MNRITGASLAAIAVLALGAAACGGNDANTTTGATTATETTTAPVPQPPPPAPTTPRKTIAIVFKDGKVVGGLNRTTVDKGTKVTLVVRADVSDEVHVHGYDLMANVAPGKPARIAFVASIPGSAEIELESRRLQIADLTVSP